MVFSAFVSVKSIDHPSATLGSPPGSGFHYVAIMTSSAIVEV